MNEVVIMKRKARRTHLGCLVQTSMSRSRRYGNMENIVLSTPKDVEKKYQREDADSVSTNQRT